MLILVESTEVPDIATSFLAWIGRSDVEFLDDNTNGKGRGSGLGVFFFWSGV
jgi:hypothetical protein